MLRADKVETLARDDGGTIAAVYAEDIDFNDVKILGKSIPRTSIYVVGYKCEPPSWNMSPAHCTVSHARCTRASSRVYA